MSAIQVTRYLTPHGEFLVEANDTFANEALTRDGCWERVLLQLALREARACDLLVDVGAHVGLFTIPLLLAYPELRAACIEPHPRNAELLHENLQRNGLTDRVAVCQNAALDRPAKLMLGLSPDNTMDHRLAGTGSRYNEPARTFVEVEADTLDHLLPLAGQRVLLKLDVQGHEVQALRGATKLLARTQALLLEYWPYGLACAGTNRAHLADVLLKQGWSSAAVVQSRDVIPASGALVSCLRMLPEDAEGYLDLLVTKPTP